MINLSLLGSYLSQNMSLSCYQIWLYSPVEHRWSLLDRQGIHSDSPPSLSLVTSTPSIVDPTCITLDYPQDYKVTITGLDKNAQLLDKETIEILYHLLYPFYTQQAMKSKNIELEKLIEGVQNITASLDLDELLVKILDNVATVIPGANTSAFWLYSPAHDRLVCKAYRGWKKEIEKVRYRVGESVTGKTFQDGKPRIYNSFREANEAMKGTSEENFQYIKSAFHKRRVKASVTVPVSFHNEIIGVLSIHQSDRVRKLTNWDLKLLKGLTAQIAIAIENARLFTEIKRKNQVLVKRNEVHASLTQLSLQNKGVDAITKELIRMLGFPLMFVDLLKNEYFSNKKSQRLPFSLDELSKLIAVRKVPVYVDLFDSGAYSFYIYPILVGSVCSGCLIVTLSRPLTKLEHMIVERGGVFLALELAKSQSLTEVFFKKTHDFYNDLLQNENPQLLYQQGLDYGIDLQMHLFSVIFEISNFHDLQVLETNIHRLVSRIKQKLPDVSKIVFGNHNKVTVLFSLKEPSFQSIVIKKFEFILMEWVQNEGIQLYAGVGTIYQGIVSISKTHSEANKALSYLTSRQNSGIIQFSDIGINRLFLNQSSDELDSFLQEIFSPLSSILEQTLITYIQTNRSAVKTAELLHIHINTFYQRLKKIEELLEMSLEEPENMLKIQLACHLHESFI